jgi:hypothetical protein
MTARLRPIAEPFVVARPGGARIRTRLAVGPDDEAVLLALGAHLGSLMGRDLAQRCREGALDARGRVASRARRKRAATKQSSSRWAGTITRTSEDAWALGRRSLGLQAGSLRARITAIKRRLAVPVGERCGRTRGYPSTTERFSKQRRLQIIEARLRDLQADMAEARVSVCRGGRRLAQGRHHLEKAGLSEMQWRKRWEAARLFICADGEADKTMGQRDDSLAPRGAVARAQAAAVPCPLGQPAPWPPAPVVPRGVLPPGRRGRRPGGLGCSPL